MKEATKLIIVFSLVFHFTHQAHAQVDSTSIRIPQLMALQYNQNLLNQAIDGAVYLVRQEYLVESPSGERMGRGILNYFGKAYGIGVLVNRDLWMPSSTRTPWKEDVNFKEVEEKYKPVCSLTKVKKINSSAEYRVFEIKELKLDGALTRFQPGIAGLNASDSLPPSGKLLVYYVEAGESPDEANIKSTTIDLKQVDWNAQGTADIKDVQFKDREVLGGALFTEKISLGKIEIELVAIYAREEDHWLLQAVSPLMASQVSGN